MAPLIARIRVPTAAGSDFPYGAAVRARTGDSMVRSGFAAMLLLASGASGATERGEDLSARSKVMAARAVPEAQAHTNAPFRASHDPIPGLLLREAGTALRPQAACEAHARDLCYDATDGRIVYRPVRRWMPQVEGLTAESLSLRRNRLNFKYSFR